MKGDLLSRRGHVCCSPSQFMRRKHVYMDRDSGSHLLQKHVESL
jgi:hypothetical protein